jgi:hypothetical protein
MLKKPIEIPIVEITTEESQRISQALELGLPAPEIHGEIVNAYFYTIDTLLPHPDNDNMIIVISGGQEFVTKASIQSIVDAIQTVNS